MDGLLSPGPWCLLHVTATAAFGFWGPGLLSPLLDGHDLIPRFGQNMQNSWRLYLGALLICAWPVLSLKTFLVMDPAPASTCFTTFTDAPTEEWYSMCCRTVFRCSIVYFVMAILVVSVFFVILVLMRADQRDSAAQTFLCTVPALNIFPIYFAKEADTFDSVAVLTAPLGVMVLSRLFQASPSQVAILILTCAFNISTSVLCRIYAYSAVPLSINIVLGLWLLILGSCAASLCLVCYISGGGNGQLDVNMTRLLRMNTVHATENGDRATSDPVRLSAPAQSKGKAWVTLRGHWTETISVLVVSIIGTTSFPLMSTLLAEKGKHNVMKMLFVCSIALALPTMRLILTYAGNPNAPRSLLNDVRSGTALAVGSTVAVALTASRGQVQQELLRSEMLAAFAPEICTLGTGLAAMVTEKCVPQHSHSPISIWYAGTTSIMVPHLLAHHAGLILMTAISWMWYGNAFELHTLFMMTDPMAYAVSQTIMLATFVGIHLQLNSPPIQVRAELLLSFVYFQAVLGPHVDESIYVAIVAMHIICGGMHLMVHKHQSLRTPRWPLSVKAEEGDRNNMGWI